MHAFWNSSKNSWEKDQLAENKKASGNESTGHGELPVFIWGKSLAQGCTAVAEPHVENTLVSH